MNLNLRRNNRTKTELEFGKREGNIYIAKVTSFFFRLRSSMSFSLPIVYLVDLFVILVKIVSICNSVYTFDFPIAFITPPV